MTILKIHEIEASRSILGYWTYLNNGVKMTILLTPHNNIMDKMNKDSKTTYSLHNYYRKPPSSFDVLICMYD